MTDAGNLDTRKSFVAPESTPNLAPGTGDMSSAAQDNTRVSQKSTKLAYLQPSVADASEESLKSPAPVIEQVSMPFNTTISADIDRKAQSSPQETVSPKQEESALPQPVQQPTTTWYADPLSQTWHQTASPPQSPVLHHYGGFQTPGQIQYPYDYSYAYQPQMAPGAYQQYANPYYPVPFSPPIEAARPPSVERQMSRSGSGGEQSDLINRIQSVLPDLARLLEQSREGQNRPGMEEDTNTQPQQPQLDQSEQLESLQQELNATKKEYERVIRNLVDENCTLKSEAANRQRRSKSLEGDSRGSRRLKNEFEALQAQHQDLASSVDSIRLSKEELIAEKLGVEKHIESLKKDKHVIKDSHHRAINELKQQHLQELASRDRDHQRTTAEHKAVLSKVQLDLATLITRHTSTKKDLEIARSSEAAYKASAEARSKELEAAKLHHAQQSDKLKADHQRTLESLRQEHKSQRHRYESEIKRHFNELEALRSTEKEWLSKCQSLQLELQEHKVALGSERDAHNSLKMIHEERSRKTAKLASSMTVWRQKHAELQKENENIDRVWHALGFDDFAVECTPELEQPASESVPALISGQKLITLPVEATIDTSQSTAITAEADAESGSSAVSPKQELSVMAENDPSQMDKTEATLGPAKSTEPTKEMRSTLAADIATALSSTRTSQSIGKRDSPREALSTRPTEKAAKASSKTTQAHVSTAEDPVIFRSIQYYQVPGQYQ